MSVLELMQECRSLGIRLAVKDGKLLVGDTGGKLSAGLRERLKMRKADILLWLGDGEAPAHAAIERQAPRSHYPLSYSQQRLWFIDQLEGGSPEYNIPLAFGLKGALDPNAMQQALDAIVARHAVLRTVFDLCDGEPMQTVRAPASVEIARIDLSDCDEREQTERVQTLTIAEAQKPFDLSRDPMLRCTLIDLNPQ